jgi:hypothetical protein
MRLISANIKKPLKDKKITKPKSYSTKDCFKFYCQEKIDDNSAYYVEKDTLYLDLGKYAELLEEEIKVKREEYVGMMDEFDSKPYDMYLKRDIAFITNYIQDLNNQLVRINSSHEELVTVITYTQFRDIIYIHNKKAQDLIINGGRLSLKNGLGYIEPRVISRNFKKKTIDQNATKLRKQELLDSGVKEEDLYHSTKNPNGKIKYNIFFIDDEWCRIAWDKLGGARFMSVYMFKPTDNRKDLNGFKNKFSRANKDNPLLKTKYRRYTHLSL